MSSDPDKTTKILENLLKCCVFESDYCQTTSIDDIYMKYPDKYNFLIEKKPENEHIIFQGK